MLLLETYGTSTKWIRVKFGQLTKEIEQVDQLYLMQ